MPTSPITIGVLALQGAFDEHIQHLKTASSHPFLSSQILTFTEVRTPDQLVKCDALILPGGESTTISLIAQRNALLEPLRSFVKVERKPVWGTCAGLILLAESATRTKKGGQELVGGLDVRVNRNFFGRQVESFSADLDMPFLEDGKPFHTVFIRAPVVEAVLPRKLGEQTEEAAKPDIIVAPSKPAKEDAPREAVEGEVEILARLPRKSHTIQMNRNGERDASAEEVGEQGDIVAVRQGNCFGTSFHPELTTDVRMHVWWLGEVVKAVRKSQGQV